MEAILKYQLGNNFGADYLLALGLFLVLTFLFKVFQLIILIWLKRGALKTESRVDNLVISIIEEIRPPVYFIVALYLSLSVLDFGARMNNFIYGIFILIIALEVVMLFQKIIDFVISNKIKSDKSKVDKADQERNSMLKLFGQIAKIFLWVIGAIFILSNFGVNVRSLIAGVGIGGIIVALAVKDVLGDLFVSFSILMDKPFKVGDYIIASEKEKGTVERINLRNTYLRNIHGQALIIPNKKLASSTIENFRTIKRRQTSMDLNISYETSLPKINKIPTWIEEVFEKEEGVELVRVVFYEYGKFGLNFKITFKVLSPEYSVFMETRNRINYAILKKVKKERIRLAYFPSQFIINQQSAGELEF
ncbi:MAG TPA: mechanosensitive ion channel [Candidatus Moranbacteria bacterium]|nr:mechanosensitive ion channel [Candidatus Moranbacteria bacterium]